jgi:hypothetical protein
METLLLELVHRFHGLEQLGHVASLLGSAHQGLHIFEEANARVRANANAHALDVSAEAFGQVGQLVHERDLGSQHGVGRIFGEFGGAHIHHHDAVVVAVEGGIQRLRLDKLARLRLHRLDGGEAAARGRRDQAPLHSQPPGGWNLPREFEPLNHPAVCADGSLTN